MLCKVLAAPASPVGTAPEKYSPRPSTPWSMIRRAQLEVQPLMSGRRESEQRTSACGCCASPSPARVNAVQVLTYKRCPPLGWGRPLLACARAVGGGQEAAIVNPWSRDF
eukprot:3746243-Prymnesium_polylepis.2